MQSTSRGTAAVPGDQPALQPGTYFFPSRKPGLVNGAQVQLYAEYQPEALLPFLAASQSYSLEPALAVCEARGLVPEQVQLLSWLLFLHEILPASPTALSQRWRCARRAASWLSRCTSV